MKSRYNAIQKQINQLEGTLTPAMIYCSMRNFDLPPRMTVYDSYTAVPRGITGYTQRGRCATLSLGDLSLFLEATMVVVAFSSLARILGKCLIIHSPPALFFFFFLSGD